MGVKIKAGYKKTKLGLIPEEWEIVKGKEITSIITKGSSPKWQGFEYKESGVLFVTSENVRSSYLDISKPKYLPLEFNIKEKKSILKKGDILINIVGASIGRAALFNIDEIANINQAVSLFRTNHKVIDTFIVHFLNNDLTINRLLGIQSDGARPNLSLTDLRDFKIPLPPLPEQKKIADILSTWDKAIEATQVLIDKLQLRKKGLMQQLLTGQKRLPGFEGEWEEVSYSNILKEVKRQFQWNDSELYKLISVRRRSGGLFERESLFGHQIKTKNLREAEIGDFLISKMQILHGASGLVTKQFHKMKISGSYIALVPLDRKVLSIELFNWLSKMPYFYHQTYISSYGVHIEKMTFDFKSFLKLRTRIPSLEEQTAIAQVLTKADEEINRTQQYLERLQAQKKGLMQQLLTGQKRVKIV